MKHTQYPDHIELLTKDKDSDKWKSFSHDNDADVMDTRFEYFVGLAERKNNGQLVRLVNMNDGVVIKTSEPAA